MGRRDSKDEPRDRVLEESAVGERVDEQREEDSSKRQAQSLAAAADGVEGARSTEQDGDVEQQADESEFRRDGEGCRVGHEVLQRPVVRRTPLARAGLTSESIAGARALLEGSHGQCGW